MRIAVDANVLLSGLFFRGNERRLLVESLLGRVVLVFAQDVVEEVYEVIEKAFGGHEDLPRALELLEFVFATGELVRRDSYAQDAARWSCRLRDPSDAPLLACALATKTDGLVTGDKDLLNLTDREAPKIYRTRELLRLLGVRLG